MSNQWQSFISSFANTGTIEFIIGDLNEKKKVSFCPTMIVLISVFIRPYILPRRKLQDTGVLPLSILKI